jgi:hypothetical protein
MKTIAQQLNIKEFPFIIKDANNNRIYYEDEDGFWIKQEFDVNNNQIYYEEGEGFWLRREFDTNNEEIYYEDSYGTIEDNRPNSTVELTLQEIADRLGIDVKTIRIKEHPVK